jgi:hypothetical protein
MFCMTFAMVSEGLTPSSIVAPVMVVTNRLSPAPERGLPVAPTAQGTRHGTTRTPDLSPPKELQTADDDDDDDDSSW